MNSSLPPGDNYSPTATSDPSITIFFPRQEKIDGVGAVMEGDVDGMLVLDENCIRVNSGEAKTSYLLIWPPDYNITIENDTIEVRNGNGEIVAHIGDRVHVGGGEIPSLSVLGKYVQEQVPPQCTAPYWAIGEKFPR
jgi:hypothetical protein